MDKGSFRFKKRNTPDIKVGFYKTPIGTVHTGEAREPWHGRKGNYFGEINYENTEIKWVYGNSISKVEELIVSELALRQIKSQEDKNNTKEDGRDILKEYVSIANKYGLKTASDYEENKFNPNLLNYQKSCNTPKLNNNSGEEK